MKRRSGRRSYFPNPLEVSKFEFIHFFNMKPVVLARQENEEDFASLRDNFLDKYGDLDGRNSGWFGTNRVDAWAECYTMKFPRLGATIASRAESSHTALKAHLSGASTLDHLVRALNTMFLIFILHSLR